MGKITLFDAGHRVTRWRISYLSAMAQHDIKVLDGPSGFVGIEKDADKVMLVMDSDTANEVCALFGPAQAIHLGEELKEYGKRLLRRQERAVQRHQQNTAARTIERERPNKLDA